MTSLRRRARRLAASWSWAPRPSASPPAGTAASPPTSTPASRPSSNTLRELPHPRGRRHPAVADRAEPRRLVPRLATGGHRRRPVRGHDRAVDQDRPEADAARPRHRAGRRERGRLHRLGRRHVARERGLPGRSRRPRSRSRRARRSTSRVPAAAGAGVSERLAGMRVVVTGASRGLGRALAEGFAAEGARLVVTATTVRRLEGTMSRDPRDGRRGAGRPARPRRPRERAGGRRADPRGARARGRRGEQREPAGRAHADRRLPGRAVGRGHGGQPHRYR